MFGKRLAAAGAMALAGGIGWALPANATNGYFVSGYDVQSKGMAGVGVSVLDGVGAAAANPALGLKAGNSAGACLTLFMPHRDDTNAGSTGNQGDIANGSFVSGQENFLIPCIGANFKTDDKGALSFLTYANGGMNTHYASNPFANAMMGVANPSAPAGVDLSQAFFQTSYARDVGYGVTLGGGPVVAVQRFMAQGLQAFDNSMNSSAPGAVTNNGYDYSYGGGLKIGATWDAASWLTFGVAYQTRTWMTDFHKYRGLFADGGNFDIPPAVNEGITVRPLQDLDVSVEHQHIWYGDVKSVGNSGQAGLLGTSGGKGFGWQDMDVFRIGVQWKAMPDLTLRTGYSHSSDFTKGSQAMFNILAPATVTDHASVGASYELTPNWGVSVAYTHAFSNSLNGWNQNDSTQTIKLRMDQDEATVGFRYKW